MRFGTNCQKAEACDFNKSNAPPWVFFTFLKLYTWYQIAQRVTNVFLMSLKVFQVVKAYVKGYFCSSYSEIDFEIREMLGFNIKR